MGISELHERAPVLVADVLYGDQGNDHLDGSNGNDRLFGGPGRDFLDGGIFGPGSLPYFDQCDGGPGRDRARNCEREANL